MTQYRLYKGTRKIVLYYEDNHVHYTTDRHDKLYVRYRKSVPNKVVFFDTLKEMEQFVQKELLDDRIKRSSK